MTDITNFMVDARSAPPGRAQPVQTRAGTCPCKTYYGNSEPEGKTVVVGGVETAVGEWVSWEANRRIERFAANPYSAEAQPLSRYPGRTYISGQDALESLVNARVGGAAGDPLARAAKRLAHALDSYEEAVTSPGSSPWGGTSIPPASPVAVYPISAADVIESIPETDIHQLHRLAEDAGIFAANYAREEELPALWAPRPPGFLPQLPSREISARKNIAPEITNHEISRIEVAAVPRAIVIEKYRADIAVVLDAAAQVLERVVISGEKA